MTSKQEEIIALFEGIQRQLSQDWAQFRDQNHNPSNKGASYEETLADFLNKYFWGVYEMREECVIIDQNLDVFDIFDTTRGENEIDVIGLFENARPRIVFEVGDMTYVPLRGAAFLCEVKSKIDASRLESDLSKLDKVTELMDMDSTRWGVAQTGSYTTSHQIRCLVYDERSISDEKLTELVIGYGDSWDLLLIVEDDTLLINSTLPFFDSVKSPLAQLNQDEINDEKIKKPDGTEEEDEEAAEFFKAMIEKERSFATKTDGLAMFLITLAASIPRPLGVDTADVLVNLLNEYQKLECGMDESE